MPEMRDSTLSDYDDRPAVIAPPPLLFLGFILLGLVLDLIWPSSVPVGGFRYIAGLGALGLGVALLAWTFRLFR